MSQRTALITGANGDVGQALCATFRSAGWKIIATDQCDTARAQDTQDLTQRQSLFQELPQAVHEHEIHNTVSKRESVIAAHLRRRAVREA